MGVRHRNRAEWAELTARWRQSGLLATEFARREGLNPNTFAYWRSQLRHKPVTDAPFALVRVRTSLPAAPLELVLPDGLLLRIPTGTDLHELTQLLAVLRQRP
jgi:transposase-like protein